MDSCSVLSAGTTERTRYSGNALLTFPDYVEVCFAREGAAEPSALKRLILTRRLSYKTQSLFCCSYNHTNKPIHGVGRTRSFSGTFAKSRKVAISFVIFVCLPVCPSAGWNSASTGRVFMKFDV